MVVEPLLVVAVAVSVVYAVSSVVVVVEQLFVVAVVYAVSSVVVVVVVEPLFVVVAVAVAVAVVYAVYVAVEALEARGSHHALCPRGRRRAA